MLLCVTITSLVISEAGNIIALVDFNRLILHPFIYILLYVWIHQTSHYCTLFDSDSGDLKLKVEVAPYHISLSNLNPDLNQLEDKTISDP